MGQGPLLHAGGMLGLGGARRGKGSRDGTKLRHRAGAVEQLPVLLALGTAHVDLRVLGAQWPLGVTTQPSLRQDLQ